jgi:hypothetical protein
VRVLCGLVGMVAILLATGGVSKGRQPAATVRSLGAIGVGGRAWMVRALAVVEVAIGGLLVLVGGRWPAAVAAVLFALFTVISLRLLRLGEAAGSCGCFGDRSARPSGIHVAVDAAAAAVLIVAAVTRAPSLLSAWRGQPTQALAATGLIAIGGFLLVALMSVLPDTLDAVRGDAPPLASAFRATSDHR